MYQHNQLLNPCLGIHMNSRSASDAAVPAKLLTRNDAALCVTRVIGYCGTFGMPTMTDSKESPPRCHV